MSHRSVRLQQSMGETNNSEMFAELLAAQQGRLLAFIYALVHNIGDAEDIYQETAIALCASLTDMSRAPTLAPGRKRWLASKSCVS